MMNHKTSNESFLLNFGINPESIRLINPYWKRTHYRAISNWLKMYDRKGELEKEKVNGYLEALHHLAKVKDYKPIELILNKTIITGKSDKISIPLFEGLLYYGLSSALRKSIEEIIKEFNQENPFEDDFLSFLRIRAISGIGNLGEACRLCNELYARINPNSAIYIDITVSLGSYQIQSGEYAEGEKHLLDALKILEESQLTKVSSKIVKVKLIKIKADIFEGLAFYRMNQGRFKDALDMYSKVSEMRKQTDERHRLISPLVHQGIILRRIKSYDNAAKCLIEAYAESDKLQDQNGLVWSLHHLGWVHLNQGKLDLAEIDSKQSLEGYKQRGDQRGISDCYEQLGLIYLAKKEVLEAEKCLYTSLNIRRSISNLHGVASCTTCLSLLAWHKKQYLIFIRYLIKGFWMYQKIGILNHIRFFRLLNLSYIWTIGKQDWTM
jgi:tetratricopeptide (TPR) repeat protein